MVSDFYLLIIFCALLGNARKLPPIVKQCKRNDPELNKCMKDTLTNLKPHLGNGIPELKLPSLNPFHAEKIQLDSGNYKIAFSNVEIFYLDRYEVKDLQMDFDNNIMILETQTPNVNMRGNYSLSGRLLMFELEGSGFTESNYTDSHATTKLTGTREKKNGKEYIKFHRIEYHLDLGGCSIQFDNLFRNNPELTKRTNELINENINDLIVEVKPLVEQTVSSVLLAMVQAIFDNYSVEELFL